MMKLEPLLILSLLVAQTRMGDNRRENERFTCFPCVCVGGDLQCYGLDITAYPSEMSDSTKASLTAIIIGTTYIDSLPPVTKTEYPSLTLFSESGNIFMDCADIQEWAWTLTETKFVTECILDEPTAVMTGVTEEDYFTSSTENDITFNSYIHSSETSQYDFSASLIFSTIEDDKIDTIASTIEDDKIDTIASTIANDKTAISTNGDNISTDVNEKSPPNSILIISSATFVIVFVMATISIIIGVRMYKKKGRRVYRGRRTPSSLNRIYRDPNVISLNNIGTSTV